MLFNYGRGRAEQVRLHPTLASLPNLVPAFFSLYVLSLPILTCLAVKDAQVDSIGMGRLYIWKGSYALGIWPFPEFLLPLALYSVLAVVEALFTSQKFGLMRSLSAMPFVFLTHMVYGLGFWRGLFKAIRPSTQNAAVEVRLERVPL
jgi:hypothetical protein